MTPGEVFRPFRRFNGIVVPEPIHRYQGLTPGAKLCYGRLARYEGEVGGAYPAMATLGRELGVTDRQARDYVVELERERFIERKSEPGRTNRFVFLWHEAFDAQPDEEPRNTSSAPPRNTSSGVPRNDTSAHPGTTVPPKRVSKESRRQESQVEESQGKPPEGNSKIHDDDPKPQPLSETKWASDRDELIAVIQESTGELPDRKLLRQIDDAVQSRGGTLRTYLDDIRPRIGRLKRKPGFGFFHQHARNWGGSEQRQAPEPQQQDPKCSCRFGQIEVDGEWRPCPECKLGREVEKMNAQIAKEKEAAAKGEATAA